MNEGGGSADEQEADRPPVSSESAGRGSGGREHGPGGRTLAICIDDFGLHAGINLAALELARGGRISAISCLPDGVAWGEGARRLRELPGTQLGLHWNLTEPLVAGGLTMSLPRLIARAYGGSLDDVRLGRELDRQIDAFEDGIGRAPDFIDGHQHVHQLPVMREVLMEAIRRRRWCVRPWLRSTRPAAIRRPTAIPLAARAKARLIARLGAAALSRLADAAGCPQNARLLGVYAFDGSERQYLARLDSWFDAARAGDLLMCHPSVEGRWRDPILSARVREYRVLASPQFLALVRRRGIKVGPLA